MEYQLINNEEKKRYEFNIDNQIAHVDYMLARGNIYLTHTEVPSSLGSRGIGSKLIHSVLTDIKENTEYKLFPLCPFVAAYIKKHTEWKSILSELVNIE
ncbi:GNAT family N-acetyltransferase [Flammeovirga sp. EKP202]|uniref:GNAT family N-acetyltransferase n=1 Tax=Flammeovirga sp. EKP202 TaxID=2770592 RepID=UPI00165FEC04|nr:GNAT family N-acetyltransferase [Flammeovirga sp. EKP202]MBD0403073.1 N-acetyltransferase [Flammeovirga sp. EKP202]